MASANNTPLTDEQRQMTEQYIPLVNWFIRKHKRSPWMSRAIARLGYDEVAAEAYLWLARAARACNADRGTFATYAHSTLYRMLHLHLARLIGGRAAMRGEVPDVFTNLANDEDGHDGMEALAVAPLVNPDALAPDEVALLTRTIDALPGRNAVVLRGFFFEKQASHLAASAMGVSRQRVDQLRHEGLAVLGMLLERTEYGLTMRPREERGPVGAACKIAGYLADRNRAGASLRSLLQGTGLSLESLMGGLRHGGWFSYNGNNAWRIAALGLSEWKALREVAP